MATIKLFNRTVSITRTTGKGYLDENEEYVAGTTSTFSIECNIQPHREGTTSFANTTGVRSVDAILVYTPSALQVADEKTQLVGDTLTHKGREYFCKDLEQWDEQDMSGTSLVPVHNVAYFYRKDVS